jgi:hypothetical protein
LDISDVQSPAPTFHPAHIHNSFQTYAPAFLGPFDVVHVRFMMCSVDEENARKLLAQLLTLMSTFYPTFPLLTLPQPDNLTNKTRRLAAMVRALAARNKGHRRATAAAAPGL